MDPAPPRPLLGVNTRLINTTSKSISAIRQSIRSLEGTGQKFEDIQQQFIFIGETLNDLYKLFQATSIPHSLAEDYECRIRTFMSRIDEVETLLRQTIESVYDRSFTSLYRKRSNTADGNIRRITSKLLALSQNLQALMTAFSCQLSSTFINLTHGGIIKREATGPGIIRSELPCSEIYEMSTGVDINSHYVEAALKSQRDEWDNYGAFELAGDTSWGMNIAQPPVDEKTLLADTNIGAVGCILESGPEPPPKYEMAETQARGKRNRLGVVSKKENDTTGVGVGVDGGGWLRHDQTLISQLQSPVHVSSTSMGKGQGISSQLAGGHDFRLTLQEEYVAAARMVQDDEWMEWAQSREDFFMPR